MVDNDDNNKSKINGTIIKETGLTYDDYAAIDDDNRYELASGQLELLPLTHSVTHQIVNSKILHHINRTCDLDYITILGPIDLILSSTEVRQPDILLVHRNRLDILRNRGVEGAPDLVVEILSPSSLKRDKIDKLNSYAFYKIPEYWIVDPSSGVLRIIYCTKIDMGFTIFFKEMNLLLPLSFPVFPLRCRKLWIIFLLLKINQKSLLTMFCKGGFFCTRFCLIKSFTIEY